MSAGHPRVLDLGKYTRQYDDILLLEDLDQRYEKKAKVNCKEKFIVCWKTLLSLLYYFFYSVKITYNMCKIIIMLAVVCIFVTVIFDLQQHLDKFKRLAELYPNVTVPL